MWFILSDSAINHTFSLWLNRSGSLIITVCAAAEKLIKFKVNRQRNVEAAGEGLFRRVTIKYSWITNQPSTQLKSWILIFYREWARVWSTMNRLCKRVGQLLWLSWFNKSGHWGGRSTLISKLRRLLRLKYSLNWITRSGSRLMKQAVSSLKCICINLLSPFLPFIILLHPVCEMFETGCWAIVWVHNMSL